jgi:dolichyl-phosphate-mannose--protein O-mannosyl transferase
MNRLITNKNWLFIGGLAIIFLISLGLRFWGLDRFYYLVFDEDHYVPHAYGYLTNQENFVQDIHPPFGRYLIAVSMWLDAINPLTNHDKTLPEIVLNTPESFRQLFQKEAQVNPFSFRWLTAFCGALIPLAISGIAYQLTRKQSLAIVAGILAMTEGYFIIESRFALINIFLVLFGLIASYSVLAGLGSIGSWRSFWLTIAGISLGCSVAVKWSGLWFMFGIFSTIALSWLLLLTRAIQLTNSNVVPSIKNWRAWYNWFGYCLQNIRQSVAPLVFFHFSTISIGGILLYLIIIPIITYTLLWIPHLPLNQGMGFIERNIWIFSSHLVSSPDGHPNCSRWHQWLFATAPVGYYLRHYEVNTPQENITIMQGYGNPVVWWMSTIVIILLSLFVIYKLIITLCKNRSSSGLDYGIHASVITYIAINYWANLVPWMFVKRCIFQYHYLPAYSFAILALAWVVDALLTQPHKIYRPSACLFILAALIALQFWLPIFLGLPMSAQDYEKRLWLPSWHEGWIFTKDRIPSQ